MIIKNLSAKNYRNIGSEKIEFSDGVNLLLGGNAQGKTNVIEAVYTFARGKSFRGAIDKKIIKFGESFFSIEIEFEDKRRRQSLSYYYSDKERVRKRNGIKEEKASDMLGHFRAVLFCPEHLMIVKGGPSERREFLNVAISQNDSFYIRNYACYNKILENRNTLIKNAQKGISVNKKEIDVFSEQMATFASKIYMKRTEYIKKLEKYAHGILLDISDGKEDLSLSYESDIYAQSEAEAKEEYLRILRGSIDKEIANGVTLFGIHRDDIDVRVNGISLRSYGSQGQQRSAALALKMAEGEVSREINGEYPVFLFDDVLSELDEKRQRYIINGIKDKQIIISACDKNIFDLDGVNVIEVEGGKYVSSHR